MSPQQAAERSPGLWGLQQPCVFFLISGKVDRLVFDPCFPSGPKSYGSCEFQGATFGERALLRREPRFASIRAKTPLEVIAITREGFEHAIGQPLHQLIEDAYEAKPTAQ